jgi:hypothetical protein
MMRNVNYVNSVMNELHEYNADLYEGLIDGSQQDIELAIKKINKLLIDIKKSLKEDEEIR